MAKRILRWLAFTLEPLSIRDIGILVTVDAEYADLFDSDDQLEEPTEIFEICSGLVEPVGAFIGLAHYSVKEYLLSERIQHGEQRFFHMSIPHSHALLAQYCIGILLTWIERSIEANHRGHKLRQHTSLWRWRDAVLDKSKSATPIIDAQSPSQTTNLFTRAICECSYDQALMDVDSGVISTEETIMNGLKEYCALHWSEHLEHSGPLPAQLEILWFQFSTYLWGTGILGPLDWSISGFPWNTLTSRQDFPLHYAATCGSSALVPYILDDLKSDIDKQLPGGRTALVCCLEAPFFASNHSKIVEELLRRNADTSVATEQRYTALHVAIARGFTLMVELLLKYGAKLSSHEHGDLLVSACYHSRGNSAIVRRLVETGLDINVVGIEPSPDWREDLFSAGNNVTTPLVMASRVCDLETVRHMLEHGGNPNVPKLQHSSALHEACTRFDRSDKLQIVELLIQSGADIDAVKSNHTPLALACRNPHRLALVEQLLTLKAEPNIDGSQSPLVVLIQYWPIRTGEAIAQATQTFQALVQAGTCIADENTFMKTLITVLEWRQKCRTIVKALLSTRPALANTANLHSFIICMLRESIQSGSYDATKMIISSHSILFNLQRLNLRSSALDPRNLLHLALQLPRVRLVGSTETFPRDDIVSVINAAAFFALCCNACREEWAWHLGSRKEDKKGNGGGEQNFPDFSIHYTGQDKMHSEEQWQNRRKRSMAIRERFPALDLAVECF
jgi:ankyrin repeat protein